MIKRVLDVSNPSYLRVKNKQLVIEQEGDEKGRIPVEDLGVVVLDHPGIVITQSVIITCQKNNVALIACDDRHLPYSVMLPLCHAHSLHQKVLQKQISISEPRRKQLWKQIVSHKIKNQAMLLRTIGIENKQIERLAKTVKSGDSGHNESQAARIYWKQLMGDDFRRNRATKGINSLLNYGYAIVRAVVARALVGTGLHPALGLHHHNQYNGLCLADDLMEPFRAWVDSLVYFLKEENSSAIIDKRTKKEILGMLATEVLWKGKKTPFMVVGHLLAADLKHAYMDKSMTLEYPVYNFSKS